MSDLSNQETSNNESYTPTNILRNLCEGTKIEISEYAEIKFPIGWENLIREFIQTIKHCPIRINQISDNFSLLDIKFEVIKVAKEVVVWRAIEVARTQSVITCANCGEAIGFKRKPYAFEMFCKSCIQNAVQMGNTGTWLDKY